MAVPVNNADDQPRLTDEEIRNLERMQGDLLKKYNRVAEIEEEYAHYDTSNWDGGSTLASLRGAMGSCATGYATVTEILRKAKPAP